MKQQNGFNRIELMVIVVIVVIFGILAAIAIPNFLSMQDRAKEAQVRANMVMIRIAFEDCEAATGEFPQWLETTCDVVDGQVTPPTHGLREFLPKGMSPANPWTGRPCRIVFGDIVEGEPIELRRGTIYISVVTSKKVMIKGAGADGRLLPETIMAETIRSESDQIPGIFQ